MYITYTSVSVDYLYVLDVIILDLVLCIIYNKTSI